MDTDLQLFPLRRVLVVGLRNIYDNYFDNQIEPEWRWCFCIHCNPMVLCDISTALAYTPVDFGDNNNKDIYNLLSRLLRRLCHAEA